MANPDIERYTGMVTSQHASKKKFMAHLTKLLEILDAPHGVIKDIPGKFDVQTATGEQLDILAQFVGADRRFPPVSVPGYDPLLNDEMFRMMILGLIVQNQWDGTNESFRELWDSTLGEWLDSTYTDNQDMTISADIIGTVEPLLTELILAGYIIPKPAGVQLNVTITQPVRTDEEASFPATFGSDVQADGAIIGLHHPRDPVEAEDTVNAGSSAFSNAATIQIVPPYTGEQQGSDQVLFGAAMPNNIGRVSVTMI